MLHRADSNRERGARRLTSVGVVLARPGRQVLADLRSKRRRRRMADFDFMDALYRAYVATIFGGACAPCRR